MVMEQLDQMMKEAVRSPEEALQLSGLDDAQVESFEIKPTGVQLNAQSQPVVIYHKVTGEPRKMPRVYAAQALLKRFQAKDGAALAGSFVFSTKPTVPYHLGEVRCLLHPNRPERALYTDWGLPVCASEHFPSEHEAETHMRFDHPTSWAKIQDTKTKQRQDEDREIQRESLKNQNAILAGLAQRTAPERQPVAKRRRT